MEFHLTINEKSAEASSNSLFTKCKGYVFGVYGLKGFTLNYNYNLGSTPHAHTQGTLFPHPCTKPQ